MSAMVHGVHASTSGELTAREIAAVTEDLRTLPVKNARLYALAIRHDADMVRIGCAPDELNEHYEAVMRHLNGTCAMLDCTADELAHLLGTEGAHETT